MGKGRREVSGVESGGVSGPRLCMVRSAWFFPKLITKSIEINFLIIRADAYRLGLVFLTYSNAVFCSRLIVLSI